MMLARLRLQARFRFQVEHVLPKVVHLGLVELGRQRRVGEILDVLERGAQAGDDGVGLHAAGDDAFQGREGSLQLVGDARDVQQVAILMMIMARRARKDVGQQAGDIIGLDDAAGAPDLHDGREVDVPFVGSVGLVDDVEARDHGGEEGGVDGAAEVGQQGALFVGRAGRFFDGEVAFERLLDVLSVSAVGQGDADEVGACEGRGWDMKPDGLELGPLRRLLVS